MVIIHVKKYMFLYTFFLDITSLTEVNIGFYEHIIVSIALKFTNSISM